MKKFFGIILLTILISGCNSQNYERREVLMGTVVTLKAEGTNSQAAVDKSFQIIAELERNILLDVKKIEDAAGNGEFIKISPDLYKILESAQKFSVLTDGEFDVTIGAAVDLWNFNAENPHIPTDEELFIVKNFVGYQHLHLNNGMARLDLRGMKINLGGIAKGYGVDLARNIFAEYEIHNGLIDFGTSTIFAFGKKKIGIRNPRADDLYEIVEIKNSALSTSGDYEKFFINNNRRYHHIINPKTCEPAESKIASVSIIVNENEKNCAMLADILSTAAFIMGKERSESFLIENKIPAQIISLIQDEN